MFDATAKWVSVNSGSKLLAEQAQLVPVVLEPSVTHALVGVPDFTLTVSPA